ncbi:MAG: winged helix-turn-helix domain-containing protein [Janthinobacterium lividum]
MSRVRLRIDFDGGRALGPGKVRLLELVAETGSISAAGRAMAMSYRRAWVLVSALNATFRQPVVETRGGGAGGGGASLTAFGADLVRRFRAMEATAHAAVAQDLAALEAALAPGGEAAGARGGKQGRAPPGPAKGRGAP